MDQRFQSKNLEENIGKIQILSSQYDSINPEENR